MIPTELDRGATVPRDAHREGSGLRKAPTGILGLDEVTGGGLPHGRPTLVCGPAGCGKTLLAMEFLVRGATLYGEPGVFLAFEEMADDLVENVASMGFDVAGLQADGVLIIDHIELHDNEIEEVGDWDLDGLFVRLAADIQRVGAKRVVIDSMDTLFGGFANDSILRAEIRRLFIWLKGMGITAVVTGERGDGTLTRHGIEEYVSDCVIVLDHRVAEQKSIRRLRVLKYRGSPHGTDEYPFLIGEAGMSVLPLTPLGLTHERSSQRVSTGVGGLDAMLADGGFFRGSTILVSGTAGTGKSTLAAQFCDATCRRGERALYFAFEESAGEIVANMSSVGVGLQQWVDAGLLQFRCFRPSLLGLEAHLFAMQKAVDDFEPTVVIKDPVSDLLGGGTGADVSAMLTRQVDFLKSRRVTTMFTSVSSDAEPMRGDEPLASLVDTWILLRSTESRVEHRRVLLIRKIRGMAHSNEIREYLVTAHGIELVDDHLEPEDGRPGPVDSAGRRYRGGRDVGIGSR